MIQENKVLNETNYGKYVCIWIGAAGLIFIKWHISELLSGYTVFRILLKFICGYFVYLVSIL